MLVNIIKLSGYLAITLLCFSSFALQASQSSKSQSIVSIDTAHTLTKIRAANNKHKTVIISSSYEGTVLAHNLTGELLWQNPLSGFMNHDIWTADINDDGLDEVLTANADGHIYCIDATGALLWKFKTNDAPMYSVTVTQKNKQAYVVAGSLDTNIYTLDNQGKLVNTLPSSNYSSTIPWAKKAKNLSERTPQKGKEIANFIRPMLDKNGNNIVVVHSTMNSMQSSGTLYFFKPLASKPFKTVSLKKNKSPVGDLRIADYDNDGHDDVLLGSTKMKHQSVAIFNLTKDKLTLLPLAKMHAAFKAFGYRVAQSEVITHQEKPTLLVLYGDVLGLVPTSSIETAKASIYRNKYSYNDMWKIPGTDKILLASAQSGGSNFHIIDTAQPAWLQAYQSLEPTGKLAKMLTNTATLKAQVAALDYDKNQKINPVYLMSDYRKTPKDIQHKVHENYQSPVFLGYGSLQSEQWDRSEIANEVYKNKRDKRQKYSLTQAQILKKAQALYQGNSGASYWGGHGNDPYFRSFDTHKKTLALAGDKKTVMIFPEMAKYDKDFEYVLDSFIFPLADEFQKADAKMFLRNKHTFWQSMVYKPGWSRLISGEYADVFLPAMEETTDKSMDLSISARTGLWASGSVNQWGTRFSRDNTSFDRLRQHSHQNIPNLALRQFVYHLANGATYINNFAYANDYLYVLWDLIGKGAIYVPKPSQILSYSPVHLSMLAPNEHYIDEGNNVKWLNFFDQEVEDNTAMVFSRLNGTWPGAPVNEWDFSTFASGVKDRRLNYLPPQPYGMVLITPPQNGVFAAPKVHRNALKDNLHPIYQNIMTEYFTDGKDYFSADGKTSYSAKTFAPAIAKTIEEKSQLLPITVTGNAAWVVAQTAPKTLRLTLIDGGYINPQSAKVNVKFNTVKPTKITDILNNETFSVTDNSAEIQIPTGLFRFIDIELSHAL
ncbi:hypothetical protein [Thalassotalea sp. PLHSN55]|uniref:hypothetical protein n=1 Tax=Thalassotalea sp. PLHSN55 TaxID=3435888 RepID=UPI003F8285C2